MTTLLTLLLTALARLHLLRYRPVIVGVTGSVGKTTTKDAIARILATRFRVRATGGNLNTDIGMPATILGDFSERYYREGGTPAFWCSVLARGFLGLFWQAQPPQVLVLEYGADRPGDIKRLAHRFRPNVAVVTAVGDVPVHVEFYASALEVAAEKATLAKAVAPGGLVVLNFDDQTVLDIRRSTKAATATFGFGDGADVQASEAHVRFTNERPHGVAFNITSGGSTMPLFMRTTLGRGVATASAAAVAVAKHFHIGLAHAVEALSHFTMPPGRLRILEGIKGSVIIDDTYNASPAAVRVALDAVRELPGRKIIVLGDMRELGSHSIGAHQAAGTHAADVATELVCVGEQARFIADAAGNQLPPERIHRYTTSHEAAPEVQKLIALGDVVLVKGSQGMRMERVVREIVAEPDRAGELLVRQSKRWLDK